MSQIDSYHAAPRKERGLVPVSTHTPQALTSPTVQSSERGASASTYLRCTSRPTHPSGTDVVSATPPSRCSPEVTSPSYRCGASAASLCTPLRGVIGFAMFGWGIHLCSPLKCKRIARLRVNPNCFLHAQREGLRRNECLFFPNAGDTSWLTPPSSAGRPPRPRSCRRQMLREPRRVRPPLSGAPPGSGSPSPHTPASGSWDSRPEDER